MIIKELILKDNRLYRELKAKDSEEFKGFLKVQFLEDNADFEAGNIVYFNKILILHIVPDSKCRL